MAHAYERFAHSGGAFVVLQHATELRFADDLGGRSLRRRRAAGRNRRPVVDPLMRALRVVAVNELGDEVIEVALTEDHEVVEAFVFDGLNETFDVRVEVRRTLGKPLRFGACIISDDGVELRGELRVAVAQQIRALDTGLVQMHGEVASLLLDPFGVRCFGGGRNDDATASDMNEREQVEIAAPAVGPAADGQEVARPQSFRVACDEVVPSDSGAPRSGFLPVFFEDVADCGSSDHADVQIANLSSKAGDAPVVLAGHSKHEVADEGRLPRSAADAGFRTPLLWPMLLGLPPRESARMNDGDEMPDRGAERLAELQQPGPLGRGDVDSPRQLRSEDGVLDLQVLDLFDEVLVRGSEEMEGERASLGVTLQG